MPPLLDDVLERFSGRVRESLIRLPFWLYKEHDLRRDFIEALLDFLPPELVSRPDHLPIEMEPTWKDTPVNRVDLRFVLAGVHHWVEFKYWNAVVKSSTHRPGTLEPRVGNGAVGYTRAHLEDMLGDVDKLAEVLSVTGGRGLFVTLLQADRWQFGTARGPQPVLSYRNETAPDLWNRRDRLFGTSLDWVERPCGDDDWQGRSQNVQARDGSPFRLSVHRKDGGAHAASFFDARRVNESAAIPAPRPEHEALLVQIQGLLERVLGQRATPAAPGKAAYRSLQWSDGRARDYLEPQKGRLVVKLLDERYPGAHTTLADEGWQPERSRTHVCVPLPLNMSEKDLARFERTMRAR